MDKNTPRISLTFSGASERSRLEAFLSDELKDLSRRYARKICEGGMVLVNSRPERPGYFLKPGDVIEVMGSLSKVSARPEKGKQERSEPLPVLFEDVHMLAVDKPRGMNSITLRHEDSLTLADCLAAFAPATRDASKDTRESGLVQRLDFYTSGAVLAAKTIEAWEMLHRAFTEGSVKKEYVALVEGLFPKEEQILDFPLRKGPGGKSMLAIERDKMRSDDLEAHTRVCRIGFYTDETSGEEYSLVRVFLEHAARHQIRTHLAKTGYPLFGDAQYGSRTNYFLDAEGKSQEGFFLHASRIQLKHPFTGKPLEIRADSLPHRLKVGVHEDLG